MKNVIYLSFLLLFSISCATPSDKQQKQSMVGQTALKARPFTDVAVTEWKKMAAKSEAIILDVRTPQEVASGKIPKAVAIDFRADDFQTKVVGLDLTKPVYVYCAVGGRSSKAMKLMQTLGFKEVYNLEGGFKAWDKAGYEKE